MQTRQRDNCFYFKLDCDWSEWGVRIANDQVASACPAQKPEAQAH